jgi:group II intron reverse transcriptase/maturase
MNIGEMQRLLSVKAEQQPNHKFDNLFGLLCDTNWLRLAHDYVAQNAGSKTAGCDGIDMKGFDEDLEGNLFHLRHALRSDTFKARPVRRVYIPKANGKVRPLGIATIGDRIVQEAIRMILEPIFEADFCQSSFGFRPNRCTMDAVRCITWYTQESMKYFWIIEGDISAYFDTICHRKLMKLLKRRIKDAKLLDLIWQFLRSGVMEHKLFKDTNLGTPQGGIASPLLANVYLHELDKYMERYTGLSLVEKRRRREQVLGNYAYVRYADDFVVLSNGTREQVVALREELRTFLASSLRLTLSMEKTKVTHLDEGFDFLGFRLRRSMGHNGMKTKVLISDKAMEKHRNTLRLATSPDTHQDSFVAKILAVNRIIVGWCRYYQYTSRASTQFNRLAHDTFWMFAHWLARKYQLSIPDTLRRYTKGNTFGAGELKLIPHSSFHTQRYRKCFVKPNPYTTQDTVTREELSDGNAWTGTEERLGMADLRPVILERDSYRCKICGEPVTSATAAVDHIRPVSHFRRPVDANVPGNLRTLCIPCHRQKTESDRQMESRMR